MRGFKYILCMLALALSASMKGQYNPTNPAEPGAPVQQYVLTLLSDPSGGGGFNLNATSSHSEGETFWVQANKASNFTFVEWTLDGEVVSTANRFQYTMPASNVTLVAHYSYTPSSPSEPSEPDLPAKPVYSNLYLTASPAGGGSFNITSGTSYEVGASVNVRASAASNFTFTGWTRDGEEIATSSSFYYVMREGVDANRLVAHFNYTPGSPGEPAEPEARKVYHRVFLECNPAGGGYFNTESGNQYEEGTQQTFRAYNNQWYTFLNWTVDGEVVSTGSSYTLTIPKQDVTLTANYSYNYNPGSPGEPGQATEKHLSIYGMTSVGAKGQSVIYPVFLENTEDVYGVTVVLKFPEGFTPKTDNVMLAERAAAHTVTVESLGDNAYRFDVTGSQLLTGSNGQIFQVPVTIGESVEANLSYQVVLSNGARLNSDGSKEVIATRSGYIFVEEMKEDGLYAQFSYEKLQGRVKFSNLSSDRAVSYLWDFGDGTTSTERDPLHIYAKAGYYDVVLTVKGQTGTDVALMTVLINDECTWQVDGVFFLDTEQQGVRYFTTAEELFAFMAAKPIAGNLKILVKAGETFGYALTAENTERLQTIQSRLAEGGYTLDIARNGDGTQPALAFGNQGAAIDSETVDLFVDLGKSMLCADVDLRLWGFSFDTSKLSSLSAQTVLSGSPTELVDLSQLSTDLTFHWTATADVETASGYPVEGQGNIPSMTAVSGSANDAHLIYNIVATVPDGSPSGPATFYTFTHTITLKPALEGQLTDLQPADGTRLETTTVTLSWNKITNAVYDVYLWNAANQRPATPVAEGITELSYTSRNFCQNDHSYCWQVVARNAVQQMESSVMRFSVKMLPNLHLYALTALSGPPAETSNDALTAGQRATISWTVRNDGDGATGDTGWTDRLWLVSDVYNGTNQSGAKLLAEVPHTGNLASKQEYTATTEVVLDEQTWGNYYLLVASDMSSVTNIDWTAVGGSIVNPYQPTPDGDGYRHLFATTAADGNLLEEHGETETLSDNFFYRKVEIGAPIVNEADWTVLRTAYAQMGNGEGWSKTWNMDAPTHSLASLSGVRLSGGRVVSIDLSANGLTGAFPATLLQLPQLAVLNLSGNQLKGDISAVMTAFIATTPDVSTSGNTALTALTALNISDNQLSGNIGLFASYLPALTTLDASRNCFDTVYPMISENVTSLNLKAQTIDKVTPLHLTVLSGSPAETILAGLPNILLYDHQNQTFDTDLRIRMEEPTHNWSLIMAYENGALSLPYVSEQNVYYGKSGDTLPVKVVDSSNRETGDSFRVSLGFDQGDANFTGEVDVLDLQTIINYIFDNYRNRPFNFTAANLNTPADAVINVQDVVGMVNVLSEKTYDEEAPAGASRRAMVDCLLTVADGQLVIDAHTPVAAFDIVIEGAADATLSSEMPAGMTCTVSRQANRLHLIGYSMAGSTLSIGQTTICSLNPGEAQIIYAKLADSDANEIAVSVGNDATGIATSVKREESATTTVYNLAGQRIEQPAKGLYIQNRKKMVVK